MALQEPQGFWALRKDEAMQGIASLAWVTLIAMEKNEERWQCPENSVITHAQLKTPKAAAIVGIAFSL
jgi:hypothetical protein